MVRHWRISGREITALAARPRQRHQLLEALGWSVKYSKCHSIVEEASFSKDRTIFHGIAINHKWIQSPGLCYWKWRVLYTLHRKDYRQIEHNLHIVTSSGDIAMERILLSDKRCPIKAVFRAKRNTEFGPDVWQNRVNPHKKVIPAVVGEPAISDEDRDLFS